VIKCRQTVDIAKMYANPEKSATLYLLRVTGTLNMAAAGGDDDRQSSEPPGVSRPRAGARMKQAGPLPSSQGEAQRPLIGSSGGDSRFAGAALTKQARSVRIRLSPPLFSGTGSGGNRNRPHRLTTRGLARVIDPQPIYRRIRAIRLSARSGPRSAMGPINEHSLP
jgi:hypothetical protein